MTAPTRRMSRFFRLRRSQATNGEPVRALCKPEVTGSIPVRSTSQKPR
jgi:hypothetical protein